MSVSKREDLMMLLSLGWCPHTLSAAELSIVTTVPFCNGNNQLI